MCIKRQNQEYYDEFNSMVETAEDSGATIGPHPAGITECLTAIAVDIDNPTAAEKVASIQLATQRYLSVAFLLGADRVRYGTLIEEIENEFLRNKGTSSSAGTYPTTVAEAYDYLCNYKKDPKNLSRLNWARTSVAIQTPEYPSSKTHHQMTTAKTPTSRLSPLTAHQGAAELNRKLSVVAVVLTDTTPSTVTPGKTRSTSTDSP